MTKVDSAELATIRDDDRSGDGGTEAGIGGEGRRCRNCAPAVKGSRSGWKIGLGQRAQDREWGWARPASRKLPLRKLRNWGDYKTYCTGRKRGAERSRDTVFLYGLQRDPHTERTPNITPPSLNGLNVVDRRTRTGTDNEIAVIEISFRREINLRFVIRGRGDNYWFNDATVVFKKFLIIQWNVNFTMCEYRFAIYKYRFYEDINHINYVVINRWVRRCTIQKRYNLRYT